MSQQQRNPFDNAFELMKQLQDKVNELEAALELERKNRGNEVAALKATLAQERAERTAMCQQLEQSIESTAQQLHSAQDRIRFDMGDIRRLLQKECDDRTEECQGIRQVLEAEVGQVQSSLESLQTTHAAQHSELSATHAATSRDLGEGLRQLEGKLQQETLKLSADCSRVAVDLADFMKASGTMQAGVQHGIGIVLESMRGFGAARPVSSALTLTGCMTATTAATVTPAPSV